MTNSTDVEKLVEWLRDGPTTMQMTEAATMLEAQAAEIARKDEALETIARGETEVFDEDTGGPVLVPLDADEAADIARAALAAPE